MAEPSTFAAALQDTLISSGNSVGERQAAVPSSVSQLDAETFAHLMEQQAGAATPGAAVGPAVTAVDPTKTGSANLGNSILDSLQSLGSELRNSWHEIKELSAPSATGEPISTTEAIEIQFHMALVSTQYEMVGKAISKAAQDVDQMVRMQ